MKTNIIPNFVGKRWLKILCRTMHLVGLAGVFAAVVSAEQDLVSWGILIVSGAGLLALESLSNIVWFVQIRALVMYLKFVLLYVMFLFPNYAWHCMIIIIILSGIISHAPSSVRYYSFLHRKKVQSFDDIKG